MYNFIRDEWLNKIIARKQHVKQSKVLAKAEKKKQDKKNQPTEEEVKVPANLKRQGSDDDNAARQFQLQNVKNTQEDLLSKETPQKLLGAEETESKFSSPSPNQGKRNIFYQQRQVKTPGWDRKTPDITNGVKERQSSIFKKQRPQSKVSNAGSERGTTGAALIIESIRN